MNQIYVDTVRLLLAIAPTVFESQSFALKGGTALNLFVQDMPRLSVDIDVVFIDHNLERDAALQAIAKSLTLTQTALVARGYAQACARVDATQWPGVAAPPGDRTAPFVEALFGDEYAVCAGGRGGN